MGLSPNTSECLLNTESGSLNDSTQESKNDTTPTRDY